MITHSLNKDELQALLNRAAEGVIAQGYPSTINDNGTTCVYRGPDGKKCAIGHLLSDEQMKQHGIHEGMTPETFPVELLREFSPSLEGAEMEQFRRFLSFLQEAHDCTIGPFVGSFRSKINGIAFIYGLKGV